MGDLLETGSAWLAARFAAHCATDVTYSRGDDSVVLGANRGRTEFTIEDADGLVREDQSRDFIVTPADLDFGSGAFMPERGDRIELVVGAVTQTFEVMSPGDEPPWRWVGAYGHRMRIHTKLVSEA